MIGGLYSAVYSEPGNLFDDEVGQEVRRDRYRQYDSVRRMEAVRREAKDDTRDKMNFSSDRSQAQEHLPYKRSTWRRKFSLSTMQVSRAKDNGGTSVAD